MQQVTSRDEVITKADLARELNVHRSTIGFYVRKGMPIRADGRVNRRQALKWAEGYASSLGGGWLHRGKENTADRAKAALKADVDAGELELTDYQRGAVDALNMLRHPENLRAYIFDTAREHGCTVFQAWGIMRWFDAVSMYWLVNWLGLDEDAPITETYSDVPKPDWAALAAAAGEKFNFKAWQRKSDKAVERGLDLGGHARE
jgi:hypothetical protein